VTEQEASREIKMEIKPNQGQQNTAEELKKESSSFADADFNKYILEVFSSEKKFEEISDAIISVMDKDQKAIFDELKLAFLNSNHEVTDKFKIKVFELNTLEKINSTLKNFSIALKSFANNEDLASLKIIANKLLQSEKDFDEFSKQVSRQSLFPRNRLALLKQGLQDLSVYKKSHVGTQIKLIAFFSSHGIDPTKNLSSLDNVTKDFNSLNEESQIGILNGLREWSFDSVIHLLTHVDVEKMRISVLNVLRNTITPEELYKFYKWRSPDPSLSTDNIFVKIIRPSCEMLLQRNTNLEDLLLVWPLVVKPEFEFDLNMVRVKFKTLVNKENYLAESLKDPAMPILQDELFKARENLRIADENQKDLYSQIHILTSRENEMVEELAVLKKKRIESSKENLSGMDALERQLKVDQIREFIPLLDIVLAASDNSEILRILESVGIEVIGVVGQKAKWNSLFCESLTGEEISQGVVARQGYTWFSGKEVIPVRRMLLRSE
jgi:hypothetical protein